MGEWCWGKPCVRDKLMVDTSLGGPGGWLDVRGGAWVAIGLEGGQGWALKGSGWFLRLCHGVRPSLASVGDECPPGGPSTSAGASA